MDSECGRSKFLKMKLNRTLLAGFVAGIATFVASSCAYDPYYSGGSYSGNYGGGYGGNYGDGYGYGNSSFSTSVFVGTGNPRWGYDPYAGAYYDYTRRSYYDPYLYGYYPVGYRPQYVHGSPHPRGWTRGSGYCPPPSRIRDYDLTNYRNRGERYRSLGRDWSSDVRVNTPPRGDHHPDGYSRDHRDRRTEDPRSHGDFGRVDRNRDRSDHGSQRFPQGGATIPQQRPDYSGGRGGGGRDRSGDRGGRTQFGAPNTTVSAPTPPNREDFRGRAQQRPDIQAPAPDVRRERPQRNVESIDRESPKQGSFGPDGGNGRRMRPGA